jgi:hypothetical protein
VNGRRKDECHLKVSLGKACLPFFSTGLAMYGSGSDGSSSDSDEDQERSYTKGGSNRDRDSDGDSDGDLKVLS